MLCVRGAPKLYIRSLYLSMHCVVVVILTLQGLSSLDMALETIFLIDYVVVGYSFNHFMENKLLLKELYIFIEIFLLKTTLKIGNKYMKIKIKV